jgi:hypothetical protein
MAHVPDRFVILDIDHHDYVLDIPEPARPYPTIVGIGSVVGAWSRDVTIVFGRAPDCFYLERFLS